jgi:gas vesicle protein
MKKVLAIIGAIAAGFTAGILTAPKSGKETRKDLKDKAVKLKASTARGVTNKLEAIKKDAR